MIGTNMRQVVSAMVESNKMTVDRSGGTRLSSLLLSAEAMYYFSVTDYNCVRQAT